MKKDIIAPLIKVKDLGIENVEQPAAAKPVRVGRDDDLPF